MKRVLIFGGTRFFGKRLATNLVDHGADVTIASRGNADDGLGNRVNRITLDRRTNESGMRDALKNAGEWDVVFDQICYSPDEAKFACNILKDRVGRFIFTSTQSVYDDDADVKEEIFNPYHHKIVMGPYEKFSYQDAKRNAEAYYFQKASFPIVATRIPYILGPDDYTERFDWHVNKIKSGEEIYFENMDLTFSVMSSWEAAEFIEWCGGESFTGPVNASSGDIIQSDMISLIEDVLAKKAKITNNKSEESCSPYSALNDGYINTERAKVLGYRFSTDIHEMMRELTNRLS